MKQERLKICITTNDIAVIENCSMRSASQKMHDMKEHFNKNKKHHRITFTDYADFTLIPLEELTPYRLQNN